MALSLAPLTEERDILRVAELEAASYPADEAASEQSIRFRQQHAGAFFLVARLDSEDGGVVGFVNGTLSTSHELEHESMSQHDPEGSLLCIHSVVMDSAFRRRGLASAMLKQYVRYVLEQQPQVRRIALIAKAYLVGFYVSCGFSVTKLSPVVHGQDPWFELVLDCETARRIPLVQVDAFTSEAFQGNPAAVALLTPAQFHHKDASAWMQRVALENNLSETAYVAPRASSSGKSNDHIVEYDLKWFTPEAEVELCGHATLSSAVVLLDEGLVLPSSIIHFHTLSGVLVVSFEVIENSTTAGKPAQYRVVMDFPIALPQPLPTDKFNLDEVASALSIARSGIVEANLARVDLLVHVDAKNFAALNPDFGRLGTMDFRGVIVTTALTESDGISADFRSRFFGPGVGVDEDPVTGSAHCALAPFWSAKLASKRQLIGYQATPVRGGFLALELPESKPDRVFIKGEGVIVIRGSLASHP